MDGRRPARAGAQNPAYRPARPPPAPLTCGAAEFKIARGTTGAHAPRSLTPYRAQLRSEHRQRVVQLVHPGVVALRAPLYSVATPRIRHWSEGLADEAAAR